ncbi:MAG: hypothetical protein ACK4F9_03885 [Brevinematia bacterium]
MKKIKYFRIILIRNFPIYLLLLITFFFFIYQIAINNPFSEEIHPAITLAIFLILLLISAFFLTSFSIREKKGKIFIRMGFYLEQFDVNQIKTIEKVETREHYPHGVSKDNGNIIFKIDSTNKGIKINIHNKSILIIDNEISKNIENLT